MRNTEPTIKTLDKDVQGLKTDVHGLKTEVRGLKTTTQHLEKDVRVLKTDFKEMKADLKKMGLKLDNVMDFMMKHLVTRTDLVLFEERLDKKFAKQETLDKLYNSFDNFAKETLKEREAHSVQNYRLKNLELWAKTTGVKIDLPYEI
ncbi:MAG: hypothetical protein IT410_00660 [Candidatus Doudnabacteria bacterium]|nr:hypothetical protein [Candidatus Doudnabacteria bacterium]